jgi:hypothetical protein
VYAHRKASDDHIKVAALVGGRPVAADVTDDRLAIRIPYAPGRKGPLFSSLQRCGSALFSPAGPVGALERPACELCSQKSSAPLFATAPARLVSSSSACLFPSRPADQRLLSDPLRTTRLTQMTRITLWWAWAWI